MKYPQVGALILKTRNVEKLVTFYRLLGAPIQEERHEDGPVHFACELGNIHFAIYGDENVEEQVNCSLMVGFSVENLNIAVDKLRKASIQFVREPEERPWGPRAIALDPDGRHVEIWQPKS